MREKPTGRAYRRPDSGSDPFDSKIFLTVIYEYRYKLCCIVNVTGKSVNKLGNVTAKG
jgi:hypothetical protein